ncbi:MAG: hypothetical protein NZ908_02020 [Candidatus Micrarchaeota archaeon]|nr:hypothetical protein [Candidatus Micrarchaeota archaeon]MCX8154327.1 hypothetical protein [Candidatus Micrarchaeota archaeon]
MAYEISKIIQQRQQTECILYDISRRRIILINIYDSDNLKENTERLMRVRDTSLKRKRLFVFVDHADMDLNGNVRGISSYIEVIYDILKSTETSRDSWGNQTLEELYYKIEEFSITDSNKRIPYILRIRPINPVSDHLKLITDRYSRILDLVDTKYEGETKTNLKIRLKRREREHKQRIKKTMVDAEWRRYFSNIFGYLGYSIGVASVGLGLFNQMLSLDQFLPYLGMFMFNNLNGFRNNIPVIYPLNHPLSSLEPATREYYSRIFDIIFRYISDNKNGDIYVHVYGPQILRMYMERYVKELKKQTRI